MEMGAQVPSSQADYSTCTILVEDSVFMFRRPEKRLRHWSVDAATGTVPLSWMVASRFRKATRINVGTVVSSIFGARTADGSVIRGAATNCSNHTAVSRPSAKY